MEEHNRNSNPKCGTTLAEARPIGRRRDALTKIGPKSGGALAQESGGALAEEEETLCAMLFKRSEND